MKLGSQIITNVKKLKNKNLFIAHVYSDGAVVALPETTTLGKQVLAMIDNNYSLKMKMGEIQRMGFVLNPDQYQEV